VPDADIDPVQEGGQTAERLPAEFGQVVVGVGDDLGDQASDATASGFSRRTRRWSALQEHR
jgi:hypothetical protein